MSMYDIPTAEYAADNFLAGSYPVAKDFGTVKKGATVRARVPIVEGKDGIEEATAATLDRLVGISCAEPNGEEVIYYLTGEFFAEGLTLPSGVTLEAIKPVLRKLGIFLKELKRNG